MSDALPLIKPLRRPRLWTALWFSAVLLVIVVCLIPPRDFPMPENGDNVDQVLA